MRREALRVWEASSQYHQCNEAGVDPLNAYALKHASEAFRLHPEEQRVTATDETSVVPGSNNQVTIILEVWHCDGSGFRVARQAVNEVWMFQDEQSRASLVIRVHSSNLSRLSQDELGEDERSFLANPE